MTGAEPMRTVNVPRTIETLPKRYSVSDVEKILSEVLKECEEKLFMLAGNSVYLSKDVNFIITSKKEQVSK